MPAPSAVEIILTEQERSALQAWTTRRKTAQALALRARIVLAAAGQLTNREIAELEGVSALTVTKWRNRFAWRAWWTSRGRAGRGRSAMSRSSRS